MRKITSVARRAAALVSVGMIAVAASAAMAAPAQAASLIRGTTTCAPFYLVDGGDTAEGCCVSRPGFYCPLSTPHQKVSGTTVQGIDLIQGPGPVTGGKAWPVWPQAGA